MNTDRFSDLAMRFCAGKCSDAERAELDSLLASQPELKVELDKLQADARLAREVLPLLAATGASAGEFPAYARERLQTKVRQTLGGREPVQAKSGWNWRWVLGLAVGGAAVVLLLLPMMTGPGAPGVQVAMLDSAGAVRGLDSKEIDSLKEQWKGSTVHTFDNASQLQAWEQDWPPGGGAMAKVIYSRAAGEVRVILRGKGKPGKPREKTFVVEGDLAEALRRADAFIREQAGK